VFEYSKIYRQKSFKGVYKLKKDFLGVNVSQGKKVSSLP